MSLINIAVNKVVDHIYASGLKKNYLAGVTTMEELAGIDSDLARYAYEQFILLPTHHARQVALTILSRIEI